MNKYKFFYPNFYIPVLYSGFHCGFSKTKFHRYVSSLVKINSQLSSSVSFYKYAHKIKKPVIVTFSYIDLLSGKVIDLVKDKIEQGYIYIVIIKIRYDFDKYYMAGKNFGFKYNDTNNNKNLLILYDNICENIKSLLDSFPSGQEICDDNIVYFELICRRIDSKFLSDLRIDLDSLVLTEEMKERDIFKKQMNYFPLTTDNEILGKPINNITITDGNVTSIPVKLDNETFDLIENIKFQNKVSSINKKDPVSFDENYKFYLRDGIKPGHILAVKQIENQSFKKEAFTFGGVKVNSVVDKIESDKLVSRKIKDKRTLEILDNEITYSEENMNLKPIKKSDIFKKQLKKNISYIENPNIGVIDIETYTESRIGKARVYSAGLYSIHNKKPITFYIDKNTMDNSKVIYNLFDEIFKYKYKGIKWYCHNFGDFDSLFIISALEKYNKYSDNKDKYEMKFIDRRGSIIKLSVKFLIKNSVHTVEIRDSYAILTDNLKKLYKKYQVEKEKQKGDFPHSFANENTLFYIGDTPDISYYNPHKKLNIDQDTYKTMYKSDWSFKEESLSYLEKDLYSLYEVIRKANQIIYLLFKVQMTDVLTISSLSLKIFMKNHYHNAVIPLINNKKLYSEIKNAYYGGITEVYKPYGENLHYYDVNSLYPSVALQDMPATQCIKKDFINKYVDI